MFTWQIPRLLYSALNPDRSTQPPLILSSNQERVSER